MGSQVGTQNKNSDELFLKVNSEWVLNSRGKSQHRQMMGTMVIHTHATVTWPIWNISISCRRLSGYASLLGLLQSKTQTDERTCGMTDRLMALNTDEFRGMKRVKSEHSDEYNQERQWAVPSMELQYAQRERMGAVFHFLLALHLWISCYIGRPSVFGRRTLHLSTSAWIQNCLHL